MKSKALISSADTGGDSRGNCRLRLAASPLQRKITRTLCRADSEQLAALPGALLSSETEQTRLYKQSGREKPGFLGEAEQAASSQVVLLPCL